MNQALQDVNLELDSALNLYQSGDLISAEVALKSILALDPHQPQANYYLGSLLLESFRSLDSLLYFKAALEVDPQQAEYWLGYAIALIDAAYYEDAQLVLSYGREAGLDTDSVARLEQLLRERKSQAQVSKDVDVSNQSTLEESLPKSYIQEKLVQLFLNKRYQAVEIGLHHILEQYPNWLDGWKILSDTLLVQKKDAKFAASKALSLNIEDAKEHCYFGLVLKGQGDLANAADAFKHAIKLQPDYAAAYNNLGIVTKDMGDVSTAVGYYRQALEINPGYASCFSNLLFCLSHADVMSADDLFAEHVRFGRRYETAYRASWPIASYRSDQQKCLNVGFVSADFREHSLVNFFEPVLAHLTKVNELTLYAYSTSSIEDSVTQRLKPQFKYWNKVDELSDSALAEKIRLDQIDILVDLDGHTAGNRLICFAMKPAPIQASWLGYLATTGLTAIDYYLADAQLLPVGRFDKQFTEKIIQLPANAPFTPSALSPELTSLPALSNGFITFGCFNRIEKITPNVIKLWSALLKALPNAKLLLGGMPQDGSYNALLNTFTKHDIDLDRLIVHHRSTMADYLALHAQVDICLDTFPSNGVTTTCHAAWMGVPTLCVEGNSLMSRGAMAIMAHLGLSDFITQTHQDFVKQGVYWSEHLDDLSGIRAGLRTRFSVSALNQPEAIANHLVYAFRQMWKVWCKCRSATSFVTEANGL